MISILEFFTTKFETLFIVEKVPRVNIDIYTFKVHL